MTRSEFNSLCNDNEVTPTIAMEKPSIQVITGYDGTHSVYVNGVLKFETKSDKMLDYRLRRLGAR